MNRETLIELIVDYAIAHLKYDDANPDVGMGMGTDTAYKLACQDVISEAIRWGGSLSITDFQNIKYIKDECIERIRQRRR